MMYDILKRDFLQLIQNSNETQNIQTVAQRSSSQKLHQQSKAVRTCKNYLSAFISTTLLQKYYYKGKKFSPLRVNVAVLTPITCPYESINGPPEFPVQFLVHQNQINGSIEIINLKDDQGTELRTQTT